MSDFELGGIGQPEIAQASDEPLQQETEVIGAPDDVQIRARIFPSTWAEYAAAKVGTDGIARNSVGVEVSYPHTLNTV